MQKGEQMKRVNASKADLHVHSKYSDRPSEWFLRRIGAPESFMEPLQIYRACKAAGMDYVTISDHNCIRGALEIAHLPDTFISSELTTYFPENGCKIHCLVSGITEKQFAELQQLRENIYDLQGYLTQHHIIHSIAHPLYRVNDKLDIALFEKLILLFNRFEGNNGSRDPRACELANLIFANLTPEMIGEMAARHDIHPAGDTPWLKHLTGGSDDHGGLYIAGAYTVTPHASTVFDFLGHLRDGDHEPGGRGGNSVRLANSLYKIAYSYYAGRFLKNGRNDTTVIGAMLRKLSGETQREPDPPGLRSTIKAGVKKVVKKHKKRQLSDIETLIVDEFSRVLEKEQEPFTRTASQDNDDACNFRAACNISQQLTCTFLNKFMKKLGKGDLIGSLQAISSLGPIALGIAPYFTAFGTQHKDERFLRSLAEHYFPSAGELRRNSGKRAWVTDTFNDVNGVSHTINTLAGMANAKGEPITVVTCLDEAPRTGYPLRNFKPVGTFALPEYESQLIPFPPFLEILHWFEEEKFDEIIISTPGSLGLCALMAARVLGLNIKGIYHTDFPCFVRSMTEDDALSEITWKYMRWFYGFMETVYAPTGQYRRLLIENGFDAPKIRIMPRGVKPENFNPEKRSADFWQEYGLKDNFKFLYVGRVSKEKNMENMIRGFLQMREKETGADLVIVGDGPFREELETRYQQDGIRFTGFIRGEKLAAAYASADAFVFPSMTDTFGNAVLEAHASGLPAIVSDQGGPQEIVGSHNSGLIIDARTPDAFEKAMHTFYTDTETFRTLRENALEKARASRWETALEQL